MKKGWRLALLFLLIICAGSLIILSPKDVHAQDPAPLIVGGLLDTQNAPISKAEITLLEAVGELPLTEAVSQDDGRF
jgi:hypothetical protein